MTTTQHTPGPWRHVAAFKVQTSPTQSFVILGDGYQDVSGEELKANASLIAAAPELLEALDYLMEQTIDQDLRHGITLTEGEEYARIKAMAAIAKARAA